MVTNSIHTQIYENTRQFEASNCTQFMKNSRQFKVIRCEPAGVCDTLYGQARVGLYGTFPEQHVRVLVFQLNLGTFTHRHLK